MRFMKVDMAMIVLSPDWSRAEHGSGSIGCWSCRWSVPMEDFETVGAAARAFAAHSCEEHAYGT